MTQEKTAKKPDFEYFYGRKWKAFCPECFRCIWLYGYQKPDKCKWCGAEIDWEDDQHDTM